MFTLRKRVLQKLRFNSESYLVAIIVLLPTVFILLKAAQLSITHDEAFSYLYFASGEKFNPLVFISHTNNHFLNTLTMLLGSLIFGPTPLALRLGSVISMPIFSYFLWQNLKLISQRKLFSLVVITFILANPFLLDFFALSRGYGIGITFFTAAVFYLQKYQQSKSTRHLMYFLVTNSLAVIANFSFLYVWLPLNLVFLAKNIRQIRRWRKERHVRIFAGINLLTVCAIILPFGAMVYRGQLYFGGRENFWNDTVRSVINTALYSSSNQVLTGIELGVLLMFGIILMAMIKKYISQKDLLVWPITLLLSCILCNINFYVLHSPFLIERTALVLFVIFVFASWESLHSLISHQNYRTGISAILFILTLGYIYTNLQNYQLDHTLVWQYDSCTPAAIEFVKASGITDIVVDDDAFTAWDFYNRTQAYGLNLTKASESPIDQSYAYLRNSSEGKVLARFEKCRFNFYKIP